MPYRVSALLLFAFLTLQSMDALAEPAPSSAPDWLSADEVTALVRQIPPPPAPGSPEDLADLKTETDIQETRTPERSHQAVVDAGNAAELIMKDVDPAITPDADPSFFQFTKRLQKQAAEVDVEAKQRWKRPRPFVGHPDVIHPLFTADDFSYPSGHSTVAMCDAVILGQIFPEKAAIILQDAERIAESRVVAGVHYETDIEQGKTLGRLVANELLTKPAFLDALYEAKAEVKH
jgi:acid phosphatase (class A)